MFDAKVIVSLVVVLVCVIVVIITRINEVKHKKEMKNLNEKIKADDIARQQQRELIKTVFNPLTAIYDYLDGKTIYLGDNTQFIYHKGDPEYLIELTHNGLLGAYNRKDDIPYLICTYQGKEFIVLDVVKPVVPAKPKPVKTTKTPTNKA